MADVIYYVASSLDGYIATADHGVEWLESFQGSGDDYGFMEFYSSIDALLMGSRTYEVSLKQGPWQAADKPSWVFTRRELPVAHPSVTLTLEDPSQVVQSLDDQGLRRAWLMGGGRLAASFRAAGLITHYMIAVVPIVLGAGIPLFADAEGPTSLTLVETRTYPSGIVQLTYEQKSEA